MPRSPARSKPRRRPSQRSQALPPPLTVTVDAVGAQGDGVARDPASGPQFYVPFALPGEQVRIRPVGPRGEGFEALAEERLGPPSPQRREEPWPCPHFTRCGGCATQHMTPEAEQAWKHGVISAALQARGLGAAPVAPVVSLPPGTRRRAVFGYRMGEKRLVLGFRERASHRLLPIDHCPLLTAPLNTALAALPPALAAGFAGHVLGEGSLSLTATDSGLDMVLSLPDTPTLPLREALADVAQALDLARLSCTVGDRLDPIAERRPPSLVFSTGPSVRLPPAPFLQPSREGEAALLQAVRAGLAGSEPGTPLVDLFCGLGTFSLPLAGDYAVTAYDSAADAVAALAATRSVTAQTRDLFRDPLTPEELYRFRAVVLDPPRAGARAQAESLATAARTKPDKAPPRVVMVSCNPATFARDARLLVEGGYHLEAVQPVDQFLWSPHVEVVGTFTLSHS